MRLLALTVLLATLGAQSPGCGGGAAPAETTPPPADVREAPASLRAQGRVFTLDASAWRDRMPGPPGPDQNGLMVAVVVTASGAAEFPVDVTIEECWVIQNGRGWRSSYPEVQPGTPDAASASIVVRGGPRWEPGTAVDVALLLRMEGNRRAIRAASVWIEAAY